MPLVVFNQKGGVGKSTIACNLAAISAAQGRRTLLIDLDAQANSSRYLRGGAAHTSPTSCAGVAGWFEQTLGFSFQPLSVQRFVEGTPFAALDLLGASSALDELQSKLEARHKIYKLREALAQLGQTYERVYIDTPPALNFYTRSALMGASGCLIPFDCDDFSRQALYTLLDNVAEIRADHNPQLQVRGIVVNQFQARARLPQQLVAELVAEGLPVLEPYVPASIRVRESHQLGQPLVHLEPKHPVTLALLALHQQLDSGA